MGPEIDGRIIIRLLAGPDAVLDFGDDPAAHRTMAADTAPVFRGHVRSREIFLFLHSGLPHAGQRQHPYQGPASQDHPASNQKGPAVYVFWRIRFRGYPLQPLFIECVHISPLRLMIDDC